MATKKRIRIYRWRERGSEHGNFGDELTGPIIERLFGIEVIPSQMRAAELLGAGSILGHWANSGPRVRLANYLLTRCSRDLHIWGTGIMRPQPVIWPQRLHVHAVRGTMTAHQLRVATVLADPGILANLLVKVPRNKLATVGLVPHHSDVSFVTRQLPIPIDWRIISPEAPVDQVLTEIAGCELIVSSSLHGLITADSFEVPCVWVRTSKPVRGAPDFKFRDYESSRAESFNEPVKYEEAIQMTPDQIAAIATTPGRPVDEWQKDLVAAFPFA